jgi:hypothetical protein
LTKRTNLSRSLRRYTLRVLKLTEGLGATEAGIGVSEDVSWNELRTAATGQEIVRLVACCKEVLKEKKEVFFSPDFSAWLL